METEYKQIDWQIRPSKVSERAKYILKHGLWTDCQFIVGDEQNSQEFEAHQLILSMSSPVFEKMFKGAFEQLHVIKIVDIQPEAFGAMLNYIYSDELEVQSFDQACELCYVANKYMLQNLLKICSGYVLKDVNVTNVCRGFEFAKLFDQFELVEKCKDIICKKTSKVISQPSFLDVQLETIKMILEEKQLNATEYELFQAIEIWTQAEFSRNGILGDEHKDKQQAIYDQLIPKICFFNMTAKGFAEGPALSPLLKPEDSFALLMNLTSSNCSCPVPKGLSTTLRETCNEDPGENIFLSWNFRNDRTEILYLNDDRAVLFSCNKDIKITGVTLIGQQPPISPIQHGMYQEALEVYLQDWNNDDKHVTTYSSRVEYNKVMNIYFPRPIRICRKKAYKIGVKIKQPGVYKAGFLDSLELVYKSYKFTFPESRFLVIISGFIFTT